MALAVVKQALGILHYGCLIIVAKGVPIAFTAGLNRAETEYYRCGQCPAFLDGWMISQTSHAPRPPSGPHQTNQ